MILVLICHRHCRKVTSQRFKPTKQNKKYMQGSKSITDIIQTFCYAPFKRCLFDIVVSKKICNKASLYF